MAIFNVDFESRTVGETDEAKIANERSFSVGFPVISLLFLAVENFSANLAAVFRFAFRVGKVFGRFFGLHFFVDLFDVATERPGSRAQFTARFATGDPHFHGVSFVYVISHVFFHFESFFAKLALVDFEMHFLEMILQFLPRRRVEHAARAAVGIGPPVIPLLVFFHVTERPKFSGAVLTLVRVNSVSLSPVLYLFLLRITNFETDFAFKISYFIFSFFRESFMNNIDVFSQRFPPSVGEITPIAAEKVAGVVHLRMGFEKPLGFANEIAFRTLEGLGVAVEDEVNPHLVYRVEILLAAREFARERPGPVFVVPFDVLPQILFDPKLFKTNRAQHGRSVGVQRESVTLQGRHVPGSIVANPAGKRFFFGVAPTVLDYPVSSP